jgi:hypothetical protein
MPGPERVKTRPPLSGAGGARSREKFFTQILIPRKRCSSARLGTATRNVEPRTRPSRRQTSPALPCSVPRSSRLRSRRRRASSRSPARSRRRARSCDPLAPPLPRYATGCRVPRGSIAGEAGPNARSRKSSSTSSPSAARRRSPFSGQGWGWVPCRPGSHRIHSLSSSPYGDRG